MTPIQARAYIQGEIDQDFVDALGVLFPLTNPTMNEPAEHIRWRAGARHVVDVLQSIVKEGP